MPLTQQPIVSLLNGISQQPASLRHPSQAEAQVNCLSTLAIGLEKRPPTKMVAKIQTTPVPEEGHFWHTINRSSDARYKVSIENGDIRVFDISDGTEKTVNFTVHRWWSLNDSTAADDGVATAVYVPPGITTVEVNTTGISGDTVIWERASDAAFTSPTTLATHSSDTTEDVSFTTAENGQYVRARVSSYSGGTIDAWLDFADASYLVSTNPKAHFRAVTVQDYTFISNNQITVAMRSDASATNGESITDTVQTFGDLPATMPGATKIYEIEGNLDSQADSYWVKVDDANKVYQEYMEPGNIDGFDQATMPHTLVDNGDGTFTFGNGGWDDRAVGDPTESNKNPPFVGKEITEVFFFRNRFGVCASEKVSLSRIGTASGGYFSFFRETIPTLLDTDPIHLEAPAERNSNIFAAVSFDETLVLFSDEVQFVLNSEGTLTPQTARIDVSTEFTASGNARPVGVGQNVYFPVDAGDYAGVREYYVEQNTDANDAANVTSHVPRYIPADPLKLAGSTNEDLLCILSSGNQRRIYPYKFFWDGTTKAQSAWSYWEWASGDTIRDIDFIGDDLYLTIERDDGIYLEYMSFNSDEAESAIDAKVHLDRRESLTGVYNSDSNRTTWTMTCPYDSDNDTVVAVTGPDFDVPGEVPTLITAGGTLVDAQDESDYDGAGDNGSFSGGTGHAAMDTITLSDGTTITVDTVSSGVVTAFTVDTPGSAIAESGTQLTQVGTDGSGGDFTLTPGDNNVENITTTIAAIGDWSDGECYVGIEYEQLYTYSDQFVRSDGETPDLSGRLQLRKWNVRFVNTGYFEAQVTAKARSTQTYAFTGNVLGDANFVLGQLALYTGTFVFPVYARAGLVTISLVNSTWKPATFLSSEWVGMHSKQPVMQDPSSG